jgi:hypothetical protein
LSNPENLLDFQAFFELMTLQGSLQSLCALHKKHISGVRLASEQVTSIRTGSGGMLDKRKPRRVRLNFHPRIRHGDLMPYRTALLAAIATVVVAGAVHAESLKPIQARTVDLGSLAGVVYYTVEQDGHRLVVSLKAPETNTPMRFVATLAPEQQVTLSVPRSAGEPAVDIHFIRHGEKIEVNGTGVAPHLEAQSE